MAFTPPTINFSTSMNGTYTSIAGIQNVKFNRGRQRYSDPFASTNCTIEMLAPTSDASIPQIGNFLDIRNTNSASSEAYFVGKVTDIHRQYDIPYTSSTNYAPGDRIFITVRGALGLIGQYQTNGTGVFQGSTTRSIRQIFDNFNGFLFNTKVTYIGDYTKWADQLVYAQGVYFSNSALDTLNQLARTIPIYFSDYDNARVVTAPATGQTGYTPGYGSRDFQIGARDAGLTEIASSNFTFSDTGSMKYDGIEFLTGNQNNYSFIYVTTDSNLTNDLGATIPSPITAAGGYYDNSYAPYTTLPWTTNSQTLAASNNLGAVVYNRTTKPTIGPFSVTTTTAVASTALDMALMNTHFVGETGSIVFRGTTYMVSLEGVEVTMTPDQARVTCYFSPFPGDFFILNSTTNGVLNTNRLGYP